MIREDNHKLLRHIFRMLALAAIVLFLATSFHTGWTRLSTDFPNYYTAASALRKHLPLRKYYDWTWFARQMNYSGIENQLGAYTPQTPLTMLPMVPLTGLPVQNAKRVWLLANLVFLAGIIYLLSRSTGIWWDQLVVLLFCGHASLASNFVYGQYYVFLLFLIVLTFYWLGRTRVDGGGLISGLAGGLKLYTVPFLFYFAAKRQWRAVASMSGALLCLGAVALALFGRHDVLYYLTHVLPRTLEGGSIDPYNPGVPTITTLLHRLFLREASLNPSPMLESAWLYFLTYGAVQSGILAFTVLGVAARKDPVHSTDFAWFIVALMLLSTSTGSYTFILSLAPVALLLKDASRQKAVYLIATYILLNINIKPEWLFPKLWLLLLLYFVIGVDYWRALGRRRAVYTASAVLVFSLVTAAGRVSEYAKEPGRRYPEIAVEPGALFSGYPVITRAGLFYQGMADQEKGQSGYVLRWAHDHRIQTIVLDGLALYPRSKGGELQFDLVSQRSSRTMRFDPIAGRAVPAAEADGEGGDEETEPVASPDGRFAAYTKTSSVGEELWVRDWKVGDSMEIAGGACNNVSPAWELDSTAIVFASDCGRAFGLFALYRAPVAAARK